MRVSGREKRVAGDAVLATDGRMESRGMYTHVATHRVPPLRPCDSIHLYLFFPQDYQTLPTTLLELCWG